MTNMLAIFTRPHSRSQRYGLALAILASAIAASPAAVWAHVPVTSVAQNPNERVPLAAVLSVDGEWTSARVEVTETLDGERTRQWTLALHHADYQDGVLPLVGFRPGGQSAIDVELRGDDGEVISVASHTYKAPSVPAPGLDWPLVETTLHRAEATEPGVRIISLRRRVPGRQSFQTPAQNQFSRRWGVLLGVNELGETVWFYKSPARIAGVQVLDDGGIMMTLQDQRTRIIDQLGNVLAEYVAELRPEGAELSENAIAIKGVQTIHHEPYRTRRGTMLTFSANARSIENYYTSVIDPDAPRKTQMVMGDTVLEYNDNGEIIWEWNSFDHLDPFRVHYHLMQPYWQVRGFPGHLDWTHANGMTFDEDDNTIILSFKHLDALVGIDYPSGAVKWILGDPLGWRGEWADKVLQPKGDFVRYPFSPHHPHVYEDGRIVYYDNGQFQAFPFDGRRVQPFHEGFSRGVALEIDEENMTFAEVWTSEREQTPDSCHHWAMGEAERLPQTGNYLLYRAFCPPLLPELSFFDEGDRTKRFTEDLATYGRLDEYSGGDPAKHVARIDVRDPNEIIQWHIYGGAFTSSLYGGRSELKEAAR
ncbi:MAG: aryl-sulfate sulfotransferase [Pacificimonas sp.]|jgi:hypothetical protein|nr:aryl-sulfate sulfotransferase [Pacificimonas sp.]